VGEYHVRVRTGVRAFAIHGAASHAQVLDLGRYTNGSGNGESCKKAEMTDKHHVCVLVGRRELMGGN
jgi:hypothetical protein